MQSKHSQNYSKVWGSIAAIILIILLFALESKSQISIKPPDSVKVQIDSLVICVLDTMMVIENLIQREDSLKEETTKILRSMKCNEGNNILYRKQAIKVHQIFLERTEIALRMNKISRFMDNVKVLIKNYRVKYKIPNYEQQEL